MVVVETVVKIRREYAAGKPIKVIARELRLSRKLVRKAVRSAVYDAFVPPDLRHRFAV